MSAATILVILFTIGLIWNSWLVLKALERRWARKEREAQEKKDREKKDPDA